MTATQAPVSGGSLARVAWQDPALGVRPFKYQLTRQPQGGGAVTVLVPFANNFSGLTFDENPAPSVGTYTYQVTLQDAYGRNSTVASADLVVQSQAPATATSTPTPTISVTWTISPTDSLDPGPLRRPRPRRPRPL